MCQSFTVRFSLNYEAQRSKAEQCGAILIFKATIACIGNTYIENVYGHVKGLPFIDYKVDVKMTAL